MSDDRDLRAEKGRAVREYYEFLTASFRPDADDMNQEEFRRLRANVERHGIDPDAAAQVLADEETKFQMQLLALKVRTLFAIKVAIVVLAAAALVYFLFLR